jgi:hypothetical protein
MLSESARMSSAAEARFRVQAPNSKPRSIKVVALDGASEPVVRRLAAGAWQHATFFLAAPDGSLRDLSGRVQAVSDAVAAADLVVMIASPGGHAQAAAGIGAACSDRRIMTTSLVIGAAGASDDALSTTLAQVRPWSLMVVIANPDDYIDDMLVALRAA